MVTLAIFTVQTRGDIVELAASKDNTLYEPATDDLSNGAGDYFFAGRNDKSPGDSIRRGLIAFDIASNIPPGSIINGVTLTLYMSRTKNNDSQTTGLHYALSDWGESTSHAGGEEGAGTNAATGDATWVHTFFDTLFWTTPGGDFVATPSATTAVGNRGNYSWSSSGLTADVQMWVDDPSSNFGWVLVGNEVANTTSKRFNSRTSTDLNRRPKLTIDYIPAPSTGGCCFEDGSCSVLTAGECTSQSGTYQGDGTNCSPNPCAPLVGACCLDDGTCSEVSEADCLSSGGTYRGDGSTCLADLCPVILTKYLDALPIPGPAQPVTGVVGGEATYQIDMTQFEQQLHTDLPPTTVWGYAGSYPGPTIEATKDLPVTVEWINDIRDANGVLRVDHYLPVDTCLHGPDHEGDTPRTVVHLHGGHVPPEADGYPEATFLPGGSATYIYPNNQLPATLWYHDHAMGITRLNVMMGLAGYYLLRDQFEIDLNLPSGEYEIPLAIQDRTFRADGSFVYPEQWQDQFFGDTLLVNGKVWPYLHIKQGKYRFRVLNGSNSRSYTLSLSTGDTFQWIGTDGGLLEAPVDITEITLTPGERADLVIDFAGYSVGQEILLSNSAPAPFPGDPGAGVIADVMKFIVQDQAGHTAALPATLRPIERLLEEDAIEVREFELRKSSHPCTGTIWLINGKVWDDITEFPMLDTTEVWSFINRSGMVHPMHMHLVMFQVLDTQDFDVVNGEVSPIGSPVAVDPNESGWKDTVPVYPNQIVRVIARFEGYPGLFPYHCHILEHEDHEMMRQFQVIIPGDINRDGIVDLLDLAILASYWLLGSPL